MLLTPRRRYTSILAPQLYPDPPSHSDQLLCIIQWNAIKVYNPLFIVAAWVHLCSTVYCATCLGSVITCSDKFIGDDHNKGWPEGGVKTVWSALTRDQTERPGADTISIEDTDSAASTPPTTTLHTSSYSNNHTAVNTKESNILVQLTVQTHSSG